MNDEQVQAMIDAAVARGAEAATKAIMDKLAAEPPANPLEVETKASQPAKVKDKPEGFKTLGEQLIAVMRAAQNGGTVDRRLLEIKAPAGMSEIIASDGGYLVQEDFASELFRRMYTTGAVASRVRRITISGNANGLTMNAVSESSRATGSRWGGVAAYWLNEAGTKTESMPEFRKMEIKLNKLAALAYATDELLQDSSALEGVLSQAFAEEFGWKLDDAVIRGTGVGQPLGILNAACLVSVGKETGQAADTVVWQNVSKMWSRLWAPSRNNAVWFVNQDVEPQLQSMSLAVGTGGVPVYMPANGAAGQQYSTLFGRPVIAIEQADTVGDQGDIMLLDLSQYLLIEKGGLQSASSIHVKFTTDETAFRWVLRVGGQPLWNTTLTPAYSAATQSPFVVLDARA